MFLFLSVILFVITYAISVFPLKFSKVLKAIIMVVCAAIFVVLQLQQPNNIKGKIITRMVENSLQTTDQYKNLVPGQRLRANVFFLNKNKQHYFIKYQYNMLDFQDYKIIIPLNLGCVGEAWRTGSQVQGDYNRIRAGGEYKIPDDQLKLIPTDLYWVLSTPLKNMKGEVIAVLNIDGNKAMNFNQLEEMRSFSNRLAEDIIKILSGSL